MTHSRSWSFILGVVLCFTSISAFGRTGVSTVEKAPFQGFVKVDPKRALYVDYKPAEEGRPTIVFLNGLIHDTTNWAQVVDGFENTGIGCLRYDAMGQGQTLRKYGPGDSHISYKQQVDDLKVLLQKLGIEAKVDIAGLSYGGGLGIAFAAKYPEKVENLILMAPYTEPVEAQDSLVKTQMSFFRAFFPFWPVSNDELYDYFYYWLVVSTYPLAETSLIGDFPKLQAAYNLASGIRDFRAEYVLKDLADVNVHLMIAGRDQYIGREILDEFWERLSAEAQASRIIVRGSEHKIPEDHPHFASAWTRYVVEADPRLQRGETFDGVPRERVAIGESGIEIDLTKEPLIPALNPLLPCSETLIFGGAPGAFPH